MKKVVVAIDSFKGSASSVAASVAAVRGVLEVYPNAKVIGVPIADGGEGTVDAFFTASGYIPGDGAEAKSGEYVYLEVTGPDFQKVTAKYCILPDKTTAVIEMAQASGLMLTELFKPGQATTYGTGELIRDAVKRGCSKIILGIGGSATNDGGIGALSALGVKFLDKDKNPVRPCGDELHRVESIDTGELLPAVKKCEIFLACDVVNPMVGPNGASYVYAPQKGASFDDVVRLDRSLTYFARKIKEATGVSVADTPGGGAAGGLAAGLMAFLGVKAHSGIKLLLETIRFDKIIEGADLIITGEGKIDSQSASGKSVYGICRFAARANVPVIGIAGELSDDYERTMETIGLCAAFCINHAAVPFSEAIEKTEYNIYDTVKNICRTIKKFR